MPILLPFEFNWSSPVSVDTSYLTEIITSRDRTEQRRARRVQPRRKITFKSNPRNGGARKMIGTMLHDAQADFAAPDVTRFVVASASATEGSSSLTYAARPDWIMAVPYVIVDTLEGWALMSVFSTSTTAVSFNEALPAAVRAGAKIWPAMTGWIDQSVKAQLLTNRVGDLSLTFNAKPVENQFALEDLSPDSDYGTPFTVDYGGTFNITTASLGLSNADVDAGIIDFLFQASATIVTNIPGDTAHNSGSLSCHITFKNASGSGISGATYSLGGTFSGSRSISLHRLIPPTCRTITFLLLKSNLYPTHSVLTTTQDNEVKKLLWSVDDAPFDGKTWGGKPILLRKPNWSNPLQINLQGFLDVIDYGQGATSEGVGLGWNEITTQASFLCKGQDDIASLLAFFHRIKGQQSSFYAPTWADDIDMSLGAISGSSTMTVPGTDFYEAYSDLITYQVAIALFRDGTYQANEITSITASGGNSVLNFAHAWVKAVNTTTTYQMCFLAKVRSAVDTLTLDFQTDTIATTQLTMKTLKGDAA